MKSLRIVPIALGGSLCGLACGEGLPEVPLTLSKNCNEAEVTPLIDRVVLGPNERVLDVAADGVTESRAWVLLRRDLPGVDASEDEVVVQLRSANGIDLEQTLSVPALVSPALSLRPDPANQRVWVVRSEPGVFALTRIAADDPGRQVLDSGNLTVFPTETDLCAPEPCDTGDWQRDLVFLDGEPALVSLPPFSITAGLVVWLAELDTDGTQLRVDNGHRLNFEPPCDDDSTPAGQALCEEERQSLSYPQVTVLGVQQDPRLAQTAIFGHRSRRRTYDDGSIPIESADVFIVSVFLDPNSGTPAGVLRSYSGLYGGLEFPPGEFSPLPSTDPPFGVATDRFASYALFSNNGVLARLIQLPNSNPDFEELSDRVPLELDTAILQMDRDVAFGRVSAGNWDIVKFFPDDPPRSRATTYEADAPITEVIAGGIGTFLLRHGDDAPQVVRLQCPEQQ